MGPKRNPSSVRAAPLHGRLFSYSCWIYHNQKCAMTVTPGYEPLPPVPKCIHSSEVGKYTLWDGQEWSTCTSHTHSCLHLVCGTFVVSFYIVRQPLSLRCIISGSPVLNKLKSSYELTFKDAFVAFSHWTKSIETGCIVVCRGWEGEMLMTPPPPNGMGVWHCCMCMYRTTRYMM